MKLTEPATGKCENCGDQLLSIPGRTPEQPRRVVCQICVANQLEELQHGSAFVLDMCCGPQMMWFDKEDPRAIFADRRRERHAMNRPKRGTVEWTETDPGILADFTDLPFADESFWHVVFDPPHFERSGKIGYLAMKYGWLDGDWRSMLRRGFAEGFRVLKPGGTLIFKWTATENPVSEILTLTPMKPLYGHKSGKQAQTHWIAFLKPNSKSPLPSGVVVATVRE